MADSSLESASFAQTAKLLQSRRERLIKEWERRCREEIKAARETDSLSLRNSLPNFLEELAKTLESPDSGRQLRSNASVACEHGEERAELGNYNLEQVIVEYHLLREVLVQCLDMERPEASPSRQVVHAFIDTGIRFAAVRFTEIQKTASQNAITELARTKARLELAVRVARVGFYDWDIEQDQVLFSSQMQTDWGFAAGTPFKEVVNLIHPEDRQPTLERIQRSIEDHTPYSTEYRVLRPLDGRIIWIQAEGNVSYDVQGKAIRFFGTSLDITLRKEHEARAQQIANAMPNIVWTARPDGFIDWYNDRWYEYTGKPRGTQWNDDNVTLHPDDMESVTARWHESVSSGKDYVMELRFRSAATKEYRWQLSRGIPIRDTNGKIEKWIGTNSDIHELKVLQQRLEEQREIRERFVATLTHDFRAPLSAAKISAQMLLRNHELPAAAYHLASRIVTATDRADEMVNDLLDANLIRAGERLNLRFETCDLAELARKTIAELTNVHGNRFKLDAPPSLTATCNAKGVRRVIENLCTNAIKYGSVGKEVGIFLEQFSKHVEIRVHNDGSAISQAEQAALFEPFTRTVSARVSFQPGWGLGLTLVRGIAQAHGGEAGVRSEPEYGTTFYVRLPLNAEGNNGDERNEKI